jgi:transcriptional repressor NrdR
MTDAIHCPECLETATRVAESRPNYSRGTVARRRECLGCGFRWTTYEMDRDRVELLEDFLRGAGGGARGDPDR